VAPLIRIAFFRQMVNSRELSRISSRARTMSGLHLFSFAGGAINTAIVLTVILLRPAPVEALTVPLMTLGASLVGLLVSEYREERRVQE
jgi:hypothetical protein